MRSAHFPIRPSGASCHPRSRCSATTPVFHWMRRGSSASSRAPLPWPTASASHFPVTCFNSGSSAYWQLGSCPGLWLRDAGPRRLGVWGLPQRSSPNRPGFPTCPRRRVSRGVLKGRFRHCRLVARTTFPRPVSGGLPRIVRYFGQVEFASSGPISFGGMPGRDSLGSRQVDPASFFKLSGDRAESIRGEQRSATGEESRKLLCVHHRDGPLALGLNPPTWKHEDWYHRNWLAVEFGKLAGEP